MRSKYLVYTVTIAATMIWDLGIAISPTQTKIVNDIISEQPVETKTSIYQENLNALLTAELALKQNNIELALEKYLEILKTNHDPAIAELALEQTIKYKDFTKAVAIASVWADFASQDLNPQIIAATLILDQDPNKAKKYLTTAIKIAPTDADQYLLLTYKKLPKNSQKNLATILQELATQQPDNAAAQLCAAQIAAQENAITTAETLVAHALKLQPNLTHAIELKAKLIRHKTPDDQAALSYLKNSVAANPNNEELLMFYSNALLDNKDTAIALPYLQKLTTSKEFGSEANMILGEIYLEKKQFSKAAQYFNIIVADLNYGTTAQYNLGTIAEQQNNSAAAIKWYSGIKEGTMHIPATLKAALLLTMDGSSLQALQLIQEAKPTTFIEQKQLLLMELDLLVETKDPAQALKLANDAILLVPNDVDLLYARSLIASILNLPQLAEQDLQAILEIDPEHANALNALGYTLSNQPNRKKEALGYLKKALELSPNNPAFMDSMAWVLFRSGKVQDSMDLLTNAYNISKDGEIAAHLGEVLWTSGKTEQAKKIWHEALRNDPKHSILLDTLNRLNIKLQ